MPGLVGFLACQGIKDSKNAVILSGAMVIIIIIQVRVGPFGMARDIILCLVHVMVLHGPGAGTRAGAARASSGYQTNGVLGDGRGAARMGPSYLEIINLN